MSAHAWLLMALLLLGLWPARGWSHALNVTTAKASLRDAHIEVIIELDLQLLFQKTTKELAALSDSDLDAALQDAQKLLRSQTLLRGDGQTFSAAVTGFPTRADLRTMAETTSTRSPEHGPLIRIRLESLTPAAEWTQLSIALPASLGPAVVTFVQPTTQLVASGQPAAFAVLTPARSGTREVCAAASLFAAGIALAYLGCGLRSRKPTRSTAPQAASPPLAASPASALAKP